MYTQRGRLSAVFRNVAVASRAIGARRAVVRKMDVQLAILAAEIGRFGGSASDSGARALGAWGILSARRLQLKSDEDAEK